MTHQFFRLFLSGLLCAGVGGCGLGSANLRPNENLLADCGSAPRCVASNASDPGKRIEPFNYSGTLESARDRLLAVLRGQERMKLVETTDRYIHAEATTPIMRYVDDLEFLFSTTAREIELRSSSRIGYYDFEANRKRLEEIREAFQ